MNEFDLRKFLYKNPLLEDQEEKDEESKKALDKKEDELDEKDMEHEDLKDKIKHHEGAIKNIKKELEDLSDDLGEDEDDLKKEKEEVKEVEEITETPKLTKEGLRDMIKEKITAILNEDEEIDVNKDIEIEDNEKEEIDIEKDVKVDDEEDEAKIEVDAEVAGQSADDSGLEGLLKKAREIAREQGDDKLVRQISNTIIQHERSIAVGEEA